MKRRRFYLFYYLDGAPVECAGPFTSPQMRTLAARAMFRTYAGDVALTRVDITFGNLSKCEPIQDTETEAWL